MVTDMFGPPPEGSSLSPCRGKDAQDESHGPGARVGLMCKETMEETKSQDELEIPQENHDGNALPGEEMAAVDLVGKDKVSKNVPKEGGGDEARPVDKGGKFEDVEGGVVGIDVPTGIGSFRQGFGFADILVVVVAFAFAVGGGGD